ncbi:hypothetical protein INT48_006825 [Thamnidium elegans]|uniref:Uncharacterized protein n=1 Tax=Thamnidium elegans TaxID=101142 RepID=A0A8H7SK14_9FUNG|nr:hypothetical protein INT48_006825 [Thamnidium elegans]
MPLTNETGNAPPSWKNKILDLYLWCKIVSISLNMMYMIQTFEDTYDAGSNIISHQQTSEKYAVPLQYGFQILIGCLMLFCLIVDLVILTTSKLVVADWYWRPGVFFFTFTCGNEIIAVMELLFSNESFLQSCQQRLAGPQGSKILVMEICDIQNRLNHITTLFVLFRDLLICGTYVSISYFYILRLVQVLKRRTTSDTAMHVMANSYHYPITQ